MRRGARWPTAGPVSQAVGSFELRSEREPPPRTVIFGSRCSGVHYVSMVSCERLIRSELPLCSGPFSSPHLQMLYGIGPTTVLPAGVSARRAQRWSCLRELM